MTTTAAEFFEVLLQAADKRLDSRKPSVSGKRPLG